jgi:hypothetical protein
MDHYRLVFEKTRSDKDEVRAGAQKHD